MELGLGPGRIKLDGEPTLPPKGAHPIQLSTHVCSGQTAGWIKVPLGREVDLDPRDIVLDGDPPPKGTQPPIPPPKFAAHVCCGQTAGWTKMPLGTEVCLVPGDNVFGGDPAPLKRALHPHFSAHVYCGQTAEWIKAPLGWEVDLGPGHLVLDGDPALLPD